MLVTQHQIEEASAILQRVQATGLRFHVNNNGHIVSQEHTYTVEDNNVWLACCPLHVTYWHETGQKTKNSAVPVFMQHFQVSYQGVCAFMEAADNRYVDVPGLVEIRRQLLTLCAKEG